MNDPFVSLRESLARGEVTAFVGAGLSVGAGLPGWYGLVSELAGRINHPMPPREWITAEALIDAAQAYINQEGLHSLVMFLKRRLDTTGKSPTAAHRALTRLPISLVFTANYDNLLERAYQEAGIPAQVVVRDGSIPYMRRDPGSVNIVKLYGDLDQENTLVLARQQYEGYFIQRPQMVKLLEVELARSNMLYLGWSHSDPHFNLVFGETLSRYGQNLRRGYAVMFDVNSAQQRELERKQIRLVQLPSQSDLTTQLANWLEELVSSSNRKQKPKIANKPVSEREAEIATETVSGPKDDVKEQLKQLAQAVDAMIKALPKEQADEVAGAMKVLAEEATKDKPNPKWYNVSIDGLVAAAQNLGKVGDAVIELTGKVRKILTGGLM